MTNEILTEKTTIDLSKLLSSDDTQLLLKVKPFDLTINDELFTMTTPRFIWKDIYHKPSDGCVINDYIQDITITPKKDDKNRALLSFTTNITYQNTDDLVVDGKSYADFHNVNLYEEVILDDIDDIAKEFKSKVKEEVTTDDWIDIIVPVDISTYSYDEPECNVFDDDDNFIKGRRRGNLGF